LKDAFPGINLISNLKKDKEPLCVENDASKANSTENMSPQIAKLISGRASFNKFTAVNASMTVEAAMVFPLFIFTIITLYTYFILIKTQNTLLMDQREKGKRICLYANVYESMIGTGDIVYLFDQKEVAPIYSYIPISNIRVSAVYYAHAWTGYEIRGESGEIDEEEYVYITPNGSVYHRSRECTHLKLTVSSVDGNEISTYRNNSGSRYQKCQFCGSRAGKQLYITPEGDRYHTTLGCPGLKRTVETVPLSKVSNRAPCSKCGG